jgi:hypothetical protein
LSSRIAPARAGSHFEGILEGCVFFEFSPAFLQRYLEKSPRQRRSSSSLVDVLPGSWVIRGITIARVTRVGDLTGIGRRTNAANQ